MKDLVPRLWFAVPACSLCAADAGLTLAGQPADYWGGDYALAVEANSVWRPLLAAHPAAFAAAGLAITAGTGAVIGFGPRLVAYVFGVAAAFGHAIGAASWVLTAVPGGWLPAVGFLAAAAWGSGWCWDRAAGKYHSRDGADGRMYDGGAQAQRGEGH